MTDVETAPAVASGSTEKKVRQKKFKEFQDSLIESGLTKPSVFKRYIKQFFEKHGDKIQLDEKTAYYMFMFFKLLFNRGLEIHSGIYEEQKESTGLVKMTPKTVKTMVNYEDPDKQNYFNPLKYDINKLSTNTLSCILMDEKKFYNYTATKFRHIQCSKQGYESLSNAIAVVFDKIMYCCLVQLRTSKKKTITVDVVSGAIDIVFNYNQMNEEVNEFVTEELKKIVIEDKEDKDEEEDVVREAPKKPAPKKTPAKKESAKKEPAKKEATKGKKASSAAASSSKKQLVESESEGSILEDDDSDDSTGSEVSD